MAAKHSFIVFRQNISCSFVSDLYAYTHARTQIYICTHDIRESDEESTEAICTCVSMYVCVTHIHVPMQVERVIQVHRRLVEVKGGQTTTKAEICVRYIIIHTYTKHYTSEYGHVYPHESTCTLCSSGMCASCGTARAIDAV